MRGGDQVEVPVQLSRLEQRFLAWRKSRRPGARIPARLWKVAAQCGRDVGLNRTATVLKLDYYSLRKHVDRLGDARSSQPKFVELPSMPATGDCVIELEDASGAKMRVHLKGDQLPDLLALSRSFWSGE